MEERFSVTISGVRPYLMHAFKGNSGSTRKTGSHPTVEQDCEDALYKMEDGIIYVPEIQVWASMREASKEFKFRGRRSYWQVVNSSIFVEPSKIPMVPQTYTPFTTRVVIGNATIAKARPQFDNWSLTFTILNRDERLTEETLKSILEEAGRSKGIGDWRPRFGTYEITSWDHAGKVHAP